MKIVTLQEFLNMKNGVVFAKYEPTVFDNMRVKTESIHKTNDFCYEPIDASAIENDSSEDFLDKLIDAEKNKISLKMDFSYSGRDGCFEPEQLFAVLERQDVLALVEKLNDCLKTGY